jgi:F0F1-type ATP synthase membrane subunit b/b'
VEHSVHGSPVDLVRPAVNFVLFVSLAVYYLRAPIREYFRARTQRLREALEAGAKARRAAEDLRADLERELADLPALRARIRDDLRAAATHHQAQLLEQGRQAAERIRNDARELAAHELVAARETLRRELIDEATREATALVRAALAPADQERLVRHFARAAEAHT